MRLIKLIRPFSRPPTSSRKMTCATSGAPRAPLVTFAGSGGRLGAARILIGRPRCSLHGSQRRSERQLTQALRNVRPDQVGEGKRQPLPQLNEQAVPGIERVYFGHAFAPDPTCAWWGGVRGPTPRFF